MKTCKGSIYNDLVAMYAHSTLSERERIETIMYARYQQGLYTVMNWINEGGNPKYAYKGYDLDEAKSELASAGRVDDFESQAQTWNLCEITPDGSETWIDSKDIPAINESTDDLLADVQQHFGGKYSTHEVERGDSIKLRIADHSGKHTNNFGEKCISIVIANVNNTEHFYKNSPIGISNEHFFDDTSTAEEIISHITIILLEEGVIAD